SVHATSSPEIYPLSLHDALPICQRPHRLDRGENRFGHDDHAGTTPEGPVIDTLVFPLGPVTDIPEVDFHQTAVQSQFQNALALVDRKSTRLNSSHVSISYAVFCL